MSLDDLKYNEATPPSPYKHVVFTDLDGREGVLVDLNTKKYYQLNETASLIWRGLEKQQTVGRIATEMMEQYDVTLDEATSSIDKTLRQFAAQRLVGPPNTR